MLLPTLIEANAYLSVLFLQGAGREVALNQTQSKRLVNEVECQTEGEILGRLCRKSNNFAHVVCYVNDPP